jgi:hypothetical protein
MIWLVVGYVLLFAAGLVWGLVELASGGLNPELVKAQSCIAAALVGGLGGCLYCLRAIYLNACVHRRWSADWIPWYFIRPFASVASGAASYVFLHAGLLVLESSTRGDSTQLGFYALAFVAGLNVDKFIAKIEDVAQAVWGIEKSRVAKGES